MAVSAVCLLAAGTALLIPARAAPAAHDTPRRPAASRPGTRAAHPEPGAQHHTASRGPAASPPPRTSTPGMRLAAALAPLLQHNPGRLAAGITDQATGVTATYHPGLAFDAASIVKADILAVLLLQHQQI
jgi:beta-lactamase class A